MMDTNPLGQGTESEDWQLGEIHAGIADLDAGNEVSHDEVAKWLNSWGKEDQVEAPLSNEP
jgi:predicted transcriptional regulator